MLGIISHFVAVLISLLLNVPSKEQRRHLAPMESDFQFQLMNIYDTESKQNLTYNNFPSPCERGLCEKTR